MNVIVGLDQNTTLGTNGATGTYDLTIGSAGQVVIPAGVTLTMQGGVQYSGTGTPAVYAIFINGGTLTFDPPTGSTYDIAANREGMLILNGTWQTSTRGGGNTYVKAFGSADFPVYFRGATVRRIGDSTNPAFYTYGVSGIDENYDVQDSTFDTCGVLQFADTSGATQTLRHVHNVHINSQGSDVTSFDLRTAPTGGTRLVANNLFDKRVGAYKNSNGITYSNNYIDGSLYIFPTGNPTAAVDDTLVIWRPVLLAGGSGAVNYSGPINRMYVFMDQAAIPNPHVFAGGVASGTITGLIGGFSGIDLGDSGEWLASYAPTIRNFAFPV